jgi:hypothetical protein
MDKAKRACIALLVVGFLLGLGGKAQAVVGIPDDVPANTILFPFFRVDPLHSGFNQADTLVVLTNTSAFSRIVHVALWDRRSVHQFNFNISLTPHDVWSCSLWDLLLGGKGCPQATSSVLSPAPPQVIDRLTVCTTENGLIAGSCADNGLPEPPNKTYLAGYITADTILFNANATALVPGQPNYPLSGDNILIGHEYLTNLAAGASSGFNAVSIEYVNTKTANVDRVDWGLGGFPNDPNFPTLFGQNAIPVAGQPWGFYLNKCIEQQLTPCSYDYLERIDGLSGDLVQTGTGGDPLLGSVSTNGAAPVISAPCNPNNFSCSNLNLLFRYFTLNSLDAHTEAWIWKDRNALFGELWRFLGQNFVPQDEFISIAMYDEAENFFSIPYSLPDEVNFLDVSRIIGTGVPGGWFRIKYNPLPFGALLQSVGYSVQRADSDGVAPGSATLRWDATFPAHRQYTYYLPGPNQSNE